MHLVRLIFCKKALEESVQTYTSWAYFHRESIGKYSKITRLLQEK
ncbi:hypothetical protein M23134_06861 [Microscilla marina ATCC 23134]|uniref:Uncharacterized protein n=1 Tax=Microscilla marina ATCC 23134 TaxID=313606 RepID=A1ZQ50_MICM2|nr:hypothetical protein M23134_06861 [Microscilla marina ATCC 23134]